MLLYTGRYEILGSVCKQTATGDRVRQGIIHKQGKELQEGEKVMERQF